VAPRRTSPGKTPPLTQAKLSQEPPCANFPAVLTTLTDLFVSPQHTPSLIGLQLVMCRTNKCYYIKKKADFGVSYRCPSRSVHYQFHSHPLLDSLRFAQFHSARFHFAPPRSPGPHMCAVWVCVCVSGALRGCCGCALQWYCVVQP